MEKFSLKNKTAVVTGGASGIGKAITEAFIAQGATVHILEINTEAGEELASQLNKKEKVLFVHTCNITSQAAVKSAVEKMANIDILVNNAGIAHVGNIEKTEEADLDRLYNVNIKGTYNCIKACISKMKEKQKGTIINIASIASSVAVADRFAYSMTKGAVLTMTYSIAKDYISYGIRCNSISPARVHTPFVDGFIKQNYPGEEEKMFEKLSATQPLGRMGKPEEVANLAVYLASDEAAFITGTDFPIDGGYIKLNGT
ncbi:SDR family NAD(P)-dependent oxidoreductase [Autumnicola psychrophila]|uniref:SDR family oxidoreductase n=1 Tax=Autumnicola psychrophila TaxID=3075592 RepID=A0ABU3DNX8_9FLAO|nr:SDR family oxidoreductase [Zunongwangia sp. F225]MDT0685415.1 SDR family oxidoreductase [Zunongwangia sp. F225]